MNEKWRVIKAEGEERRWAICTEDGLHWPFGNWSFQEYEAREIVRRWNAFETSQPKQEASLKPKKTGFAVLRRSLVNNNLTAFWDVSGGVPDEYVADSKDWQSAEKKGEILLFDSLTEASMFVIDKRGRFVQNEIWEVQFAETERGYSSKTMGYNVIRGDFQLIRQAAIFPADK